MTRIKMKFDYSKNCTDIPNIFIDKYMSTKLANPTYTVVYIFLYSHWQRKNKDLTIEYASKTLGVLASDVVNSLRFWAELGLVSLREEDNEISFSFIDNAFCEPDVTCPSTSPLDSGYDTAPMLSIKSGTTSTSTNTSTSTSASKEAAKDNEQELTTYENVLPIVFGKDTPQKKEFVKKDKPDYSSEELAIYLEQSAEIKNLFNFAQNSLGKLLSYNDMNTIFAFYDWLRLPVAVIETLLTFCVDNNQRKLSLIEREAILWANEGINTNGMTRTYIDLYNNEFKKILKALDEDDTAPDKKQVKYMKKWLFQYEFSLDIILEACDKTIDQISKPYFPYTDGILTNWFNNGVITISDIKSFDTSLQDKIANSKAPKITAQKQVSKTKQSRFVNFKQRDWDYDKIEQLERKHLENSMNHVK